MLNEVKTSIEPRLSMQDTLTNWSTISERLAESPRQRKNQSRRIESHAQTT
jgi:hypothetical protein